MSSLNSQDRIELNNLLSDIPELQTEAGRRQILELAGLSDFIPRMNLAGSTGIVLGTIVTVLEKYGQLETGEEALGKFLVYIKTYVGLTQKKVIDRLLREYELIETIPESESVQPEPPTFSSENQGIEVFFSYAHEDEKLRDELAKHLKLLERQGVITAWHDRQITAGTEWSGQIDEHLESAKVILLLISADFLASDYCYDVELKRAMERHEAKTARVIPVIMREVDWKGASFGKLQALPKNALPVTNWSNLDQAFTDIARGIRKAVEELSGKK